LSFWALLPLRTVAAGMAGGVSRCFVAADKRLNQPVRMDEA
jgi:hypothetical protein